MYIEKGPQLTHKNILTYLGDAYRMKRIAVFQMKR